LEKLKLGSAYTPGLSVTADTVVRRVRRLPIKGEVLVHPGDRVNPRDTVARAMLPGMLQTIKLADVLGVEANEIKSLFKLNEGDAIDKGQQIAETKGFFGLGKKPVFSDYAGTVEAISDVSGSVLVREPSVPVGIDAYIEGHVAEVMPEEGAIIETRCALVQGIFGVGGERTGTIRAAVESNSEVLDAKHIEAGDAGKILVGGSGITYDAIIKATEIGVTGLIAGGIRDSDLIKFLGYDIGVAITGQESIPVTIMVTEGFGTLNMAERTFNLLKSLQGKSASLNGATQIRAGVIRPEVIVPTDVTGTADNDQQPAMELKAGTPIRIIREPYFGRLGSVTDLPAQLQVVESGTEVRVLMARLDSGEEVCVPRANVEIIAT